MWHDARRFWITGSKCGRITPRPVEWGRRNENIAKEAYVVHMKSHGHPRIQVQACGLFVYPMKGWLATSPDAQVNDPDA